MPAAPNEQPDNLTDLREALEGKYGEDGMFLPYVGEETYAAYETALIFINEIIANAEPNFVARNSTAVKAAMIEASLWLRTLTRLHMYAGLAVDESRPEAATLKQAQDRMLAASERYREAINTPTRPQDQELLDLWQLASAPSAYAVILRQHIEEIRLAGDDQQRAGAHNLAARNAFLKMGILVVELTETAKIKTGGPRPSHRQAQRCLYGARQAMLEFQEAHQLIKNTRPLRMHESIAGDAEKSREAQEMVAEIRQEGKSHHITIDVQHPEQSLLAYEDDYVYRVKRIADEYPAETDSSVAEAHALSLETHARYHAEHHSEQATETISRWAEMTFSNAIADLHRVSRTEFTRMTRLIHEASQNPLATREVAKETVIHDNSGADLMLQLAMQNINPVTDQQADIVIRTARDAGIPEGQLQAICSIMGKTPQQMGIEPVLTPTARLIEILDACPMELHPHQVLTIARILGANQNDDDLDQWISENCGVEDEDDDIMNSHIPGS